MVEVHIHCVCGIIHVIALGIVNWQMFYGKEWKTGQNIAIHIVFCIYIYIYIYMYQLTHSLMFL